MGVPGSCLGSVFSYKLSSFISNQVTTWYEELLQELINLALCVHKCQAIRRVPVSAKRTSLLPSFFVGVCC
jgi:hypothetical protein